MPLLTVLSYGIPVTSKYWMPVLSMTENAISGEDMILRPVDGFSKCSSLEVECGQGSELTLSLGMRMMSKLYLDHKETDTKVHSLRINEDSFVVMVWGGDIKVIKTVPNIKHAHFLIDNAGSNARVVGDRMETGRWNPDLTSTQTPLYLTERLCVVPLALWDKTYEDPVLQYKLLDVKGRQVSWDGEAYKNRKVFIPRSNSIIIYSKWGDSSSYDQVTLMRRTQMVMRCYPVLNFNRNLSQKKGTSAILIYCLL